MTTVEPPVPSSLTTEELVALTSAVRGRVAVPSDPDWAGVSMAWSLVPQAPVAVVEAADADDVEATVRWAAAHGRSVAAQPGGHGATGSADGAVLLRTRALNTVEIDADARVARVGAGVKWGELLPSLNDTGLIGLAGSNPDVSVVGYHLGGGLSWFARSYGYAVHALRAAEVVDAEGRRRWISDETDPDLMWALRGGGGDLVIVTAVEIDLPAEPALYGGKLMFGVGDAEAVFRAFAEAARTAPQALTLWAAVMHFPDVEMLPEPMRGQSFVSIDTTYLGPRAEAEALLAPIRAAGTLVNDTTAEFLIGNLGDVAAEPTDPTPTIDWTSHLSEFTGDTAARLAEAVADPTRTAVNILQVRHLGGALADPPARRPAVADHVDAPFVAGAFGVPMVPELVEPIRWSLAAVAQALAPELSPERFPLNFLTVDSTIDHAFDSPTLERLRAIKRRVDPRGTIRGNFPLG